MELLPPQVSPYGEAIDHLFYWITAFVLFALVVSWGLLLYPLLRFQHNPKPRYLPGNSWKQFRFVALFLVVLAAADFSILFKEHPIWAATQGPPPSGSLKIGVIARQWSWEFLYPGADGVLRTPDDLVVAGDPTLVVPVDRPIEVHLYSRDVLHSFFVPALRFKYDVIPGRTVVRWFIASKTGKYEILCAEICGVLHSRMRGVLKVVSEEEFAAYLKRLEEGKGSPGK